MIYYIIAFIGSQDSIAAVFQPQINGVFFLMMADRRFWAQLMTVPFIALIPDMTYKLGHAIFYPYPGEAIMKHQKQHPHYTYHNQEEVMNTVGDFISGIVKKNKSVGQLTSKVLSEVDKASDISHVDMTEQHLSLNTNYNPKGNKGTDTGWKGTKGQSDSSNVTPTLQKKKTRTGGFLQILNDSVDVDPANHLAVDEDNTVIKKRSAFFPKQATFSGKTKEKEENKKAKKSRGSTAAGGGGGGGNDMSFRSKPGSQKESSYKDRKKKLMDHIKGREPTKSEVT